MKNRVVFVGAGPGDIELITLKGMNVLKKADLIIYAGSLINRELLKYNENNAECYDSAYMTLDEIIALMERGYNEGKTVARLHTGDGAIYGAISEQIKKLEEKNIPYEIVPGVSSFLGGAAALKKELTIPERSQTVICTRISGKTFVKEEESLSKLASHKATMVIFLSIARIDDVVRELLEGGYEANTPVAVVYKATWPEEKIIYGMLSNISEEIKKEKINKTALIYVGEFLEKSINSKLYDKTFAHEFREKR